ncbi:major facilitator superfamily domain-containing protein [Gilbertella persicaria]|uniref:major facilitator superfamily domain-containing protein n=1 Tax=Gilbertella persicaria TaxID=101096 RepID=UPI00221FCF26|nr:major facilitator superfamily domain-containing protein [Gilbertella persicaria]KAI8054193.1 major facilitator superfamily domain-containing protein [Gilbertella persicaria]
MKTEAEKKLLRKINFTFMPFACLILFIQFIDKSALSTISVMPQFYADTGINRDQYSWLGSIFYLGFLCMQLPNNYMMHKFPLSKYVGAILVIWGIVLFSTAFSKNFGHLIALRFLLGFFEAITYPSMFLLIATMYRRSEQVLGFGVMFLSNSVGMIIGGVIGVGIMEMPTVGNISPWKWSMIIFGSVTILMGIVYFIFLPDRPDSRWFRLTEEEKSIVEDRVRDNAVIRTYKVNKDQIWEALKEPRLYCYCLISLFIELQNGALTTFQSIIIADLGFSSTNAVLLTIPGGVFALLLVAGSTSLSKRWKETIWMAIAMCTISVIGLILLAVIPSGGIKLFGLYLSWGCTPTYVLMQASITSNVSGYTKKIFYTSGNMISYTLGNFIGPLLLRSKEAPHYLTGMSIYIAANVLVILIFLYLRFSYVRANKMRNLDKNDNTVALPDDLEDISDVQNPKFVYRT